MTQIRRGTHYNIPCYLMENEKLSVKVGERFGAKILSLYHKEKDFESLFQPTNEAYFIPEFEGDFSRYDTSGLDDCIPTIDACRYPGEFIRQEHGQEVFLPDHGEVWSLPWDIHQEGSSLICRVHLKKLPLLFSRKMTLDKEKLLLHYEVENLSNFDVGYLWALHGLNTYQENAKVFFEPALQSPINVMGKGEYEFNWKHLKEYADQKSYKFYFSEKAQEGYCGIYYEDQKIRYTIDFEPDKQPYVGMWLTKGGFKGEYNLALEPCNGFYDSLEQAVKHRKFTVLKPREKHCWKIGIELR